MGGGEGTEDGGERRVGGKEAREGVRGERETVLDSYHLQSCIGLT